MRDIRERPVTIVAPQLTATEICDVQVHPSVIVEITRRDSHPIATRVDAALLCDIRELQRPSAVAVDQSIIPVQPAFQGKRTSGRKPGIRQPLARPQHRSLDDENVQIAVIIVVKERRPGAHHLGEIMLSGHAVKMNEIDPHFPGFVAEYFRG